MASSSAMPTPTRIPVDHRIEVRHRSCGSWLASDEAGKNNLISKMVVEADGLIVGNADSHQDPG